MLFAVIGVPFLLSLVLALGGRWLPKNIQTWSLTAVMVGLFGVLVSFAPEIAHDGAVVSPSIVWVSALGLSFSVYLDGLALLFGLVVTGIGAVIFLYTGYYFEDAAKQTRFNMWLLAFAGAMLGVVLSGNLLTMFVMWELTSITSYMLIGFYGGTDDDARLSAMRALVVTGGGGLALGAGVLLLGVMAAQLTEANALVLDYGELLAVEGIASHPYYIAAAVLLMLGAFTKSAQWPFHFWLPGAMTAPTPASSFLHSATMVKAGVYLLARLHPLMAGHVFWQNTVLTVGLFTMLMSAVFALKQRDLKGLLAYSTTSWLGVLVAFTALPEAAGFKALTVGILAHALYKSALFLAVGSIDHTTGTRIIDELGGLWAHMKGIGVVVIISALSMAGVPLLFGFVAKEVLLDVVLHEMTATYLGDIALWAVMATAALNGTAAYIIIWDVFFAPAPHEPHIHHMKPMATVGPLILAIGGTFTLPFLLQPLIVPLIDMVTHKHVHLHLIPSWGVEFQLSLLAICLGLAVFLVRRPIVAGWQFLPFNGAQVYAGFIGLLDRIAKGATFFQHGEVRYYLSVILGIVGVILILPPIQRSFIRWETFVPSSVVGLNPIDGLTVGLLVLAIGAALSSVIVRKHLHAALSVSVFGYAVAGVYVLSYAPDLAMVQFLIETLSTVLIIIMISRIDSERRKQMSDALWKIRKRGLLRDVLISVLIGTTVFLFVLTAVVNRPDRVSISGWYIEHTYEEIGISDVVAAIVTDFRGMDTFFEIAVFAVAGLGVLTLIETHREHKGDIRETHELPAETPPLLTPFTRTASLLLFPITLLLAFVHLFYGGDAPGDGFTAGVVAGLALTLGYVVFGYVQIHEQIPWARPPYFVTGGLLLSVANAAFPLLIGREWLSHLVWHGFSFAGIKVASSLVFEAAIALTVFGGVGLVMQAIAHPELAAELPGDYDPIRGSSKSNESEVSTS